MTERKWTKGPWVVSEDCEGYWINDTDGYHVGSAEASIDNAIHDAHLIAAAPDLYEALVVIVSFGVDEASWQTAYDALAKARGK